MNHGDWYCYCTGRPQTPYKYSTAVQYPYCVKILAAAVILVAKKKGLEEEFLPVQADYPYKIHE